MCPVSENALEGGSMPEKNDAVGRHIFWTSDDLELIRTCRQADGMSYNDVAAILGVQTATVTGLARKLGIFKSGERILGRQGTRRNPSRASA